MDKCKYTTDFETWALFQKKMGNSNPTESDFQKVLELIKKIRDIEQNGISLEPSDKYSQTDLENHLSESSNNTFDSYISSKQ